MPKRSPQNKQVVMGCGGEDNRNTKGPWNFSQTTKKRLRRTTLHWYSWCAISLFTERQFWDRLLVYLLFDFFLFSILMATVLVYINRPCKMYPPMTKTMVLSGFETLIILWICALTKLFPTIMIIASNIQI